MASKMASEKASETTSETQNQYWVEAVDTGNLLKWASETASELPMQK